MRTFSATISTAIMISTTYNKLWTTVCSCSYMVFRITKRDGFKKTWIETVRKYLKTQILSDKEMPWSRPNENIRYMYSLILILSFDDDYNDGMFRITDIQ